MHGMGGQVRQAVRQAGAVGEEFVYPKMDLKNNPPQRLKVGEVGFRLSKSTDSELIFPGWYGFSRPVKS